MKSNQIEPMLRSLENIELQYKESVGHAAALELRMRVLAEINPAISKHAESLVHPRDAYKFFWECKLEHLIDAILEIFKQDLSSDEIQQLNSFKNQRNKLLHGILVEFMRLMKVQPTSRKILKNGSRDNLKDHEVIEAIKSTERNHVLVKFNGVAAGLMEIINKLIRKSTN